MNQKIKIGIIGAGTMGSGIAQVAATAGHQVILFDSNSVVLDKAKTGLKSILTALVEKQKITNEQSTEIYGRIVYASQLSDFRECSLVIEAIVENLEVKQKVFSEVENIVFPDCILATNTSSLSVTSIASACSNPGRLVGIHFFNPAPLMPLVEIVKGILTSEEIVQASQEIIRQWSKITVLAKDSPGFIVNRLARPFYGESIRIYEEGIADFATIDWAMREFGKFKMGPFELMDLIGNDVNYTVTETVWKQFFYDPRYKPSLTQRRLFEAKHFGKKSGRGYYDYSPNSVKPEPMKDPVLGEMIFMRVLSMLINEAADALYLDVATMEDLDVAMMKGVNYPKGLLAWCNEIGAEKILNVLEVLKEKYSEDRYRPSVLLKQMVKENKKFYG
jgi:3-hydroxybutyryl-CoA dehydrogenase